MKLTQILRSAVSKFFMSNSVGGGSFWGWSKPGEWSRQQLLGQYVRKTYAIISKIAEAEAKISLEAYTANINGDEKVVNNSDFIKLLRKPNSQNSQFQFLEMHFTMMKLMGESFWYMARGVRQGKPMELYMLRPDLMDVAVDQNDNRGLVSGYVLNKPDGSKVTFEVNEIVHFKLPNPENPYRGMGPVQAGKIYIQTEEFSSKWTRNALYNSGRPSGVLEFKGTITDAQFEKVKRQYRNEYSGVENAGKTLFVKGTDGVSFTKMGMELQEIALKEMKDMSQDDLLFMFGANKSILGVTDDVNRANAHEARVQLNENIIKPDWDRFIDHVNAFIMPNWNKEVYLKYKKPSLKSDAERLEEDDKLVDRIKTRNEIREERGLDPIEGGGFLYIPINEVPLGTTPTESKAAKSLKKKV